MAIDPRAQSLDVKRAEVEFHNFASLGEPERASRTYQEENERRHGILQSMAAFLGQPLGPSLTPFLEIGANAGHTSLMLMNQLGAAGFALDISADSLRYGYALMDRWKVTRGPVRVAGDALHLPFRDGSLRFVMACQMLSQFMNIESVLIEAKRVLAPGGVFFFCEEPMRRVLTLRLWRAPYVEQMRPWERRLWDWGLLPFLVRDVVGAGQEESFGIRQNHTMHLGDWRVLLERHFPTQEYRLFVPERGPWERAVKRAAIRLDPHRSTWRAARLLGGTLAAACRKEGVAVDSAMPERFEDLLQCPDCGGDLARDMEETLACKSCGCQARLDDGVYNLLRSADRAELYPGDRPDIVDFSRSAHEAALGEGWHGLEGIYGNKYRWIGRTATVTLQNLSDGPARLRIRGFRPSGDQPFVLDIDCNGGRLGTWTLRRPGLFVVETPLPAAARYEICLHGSPVWRPDGDPRDLSLNFSLIRLLPPDEKSATR